MLTNATVVDDAIRFVSQKSKENLKSSTESGKEESKEPDYDEDKDQLEEEAQRRLIKSSESTCILKEVAIE